MMSQFSCKVVIVTFILSFLVCLWKTEAQTTGVTGPSSSRSPFLVSLADGVQLTSILTVNDHVGGYRMSGVPDGLGAYDNGDGTFTLLMNHELLSTYGEIRKHGSKGAFVSRWIIRKNDLTVISGQDLIKKMFLWNSGRYIQYNAANPSPIGFSRFCSGDLPAPSAFYFASQKAGTKEMIFMNGEESGMEGRAFAHFVKGPLAGSSYELPGLGKFNWENALANPTPQMKTIVAGTDDVTGGQVYFYVGTKSNRGTELKKSGLIGGFLYGVSVEGYTAETDANIPSPGTRFSLASFGNANEMSGADLHVASLGMGVTSFLRPEDGAWDPVNPRDFYFTTTNAYTGPSRLWRLRFDDITHPESGGVIDAVLDGTEGQKMLDNLTISKRGHVLMQEDPGNYEHLAKVWQYDIESDNLKALAEHDPSRFATAGAEFLTQDEESSGILDVQEILGPGKFLLVVQGDYFSNGEFFEAGQLICLFNPDSYNKCLPLSGEIAGDISPCEHMSKKGTLAHYSVDAENVGEFSWWLTGGGKIIHGQGTNEIAVNFPDGFRKGSVNVQMTGICGNLQITRSISVIRDWELAGNIEGPSVICDFELNGFRTQYTIKETPYFTHYKWSVPEGARIIGGQGTNTISVEFSASLKDTPLVKVQLDSDCRQSVKRSIVLQGTSCDASSRMIPPTVSVYPVPAKDIQSINVDFTTSQPYRILVTDLSSGKQIVMRSGLAAEGINNILVDISDLSNGFYKLDFITPTFTHTKRIEVRK